MSAVIAIVIGIIVLVLLLKVALGMIALLFGLAAAVVIYFIAEKLIGGPRAR